MSNNRSQNPKAAKSQHLPRETYVFCLRSPGQGALGDTGLPPSPSHPPPSHAQGTPGSWGGAAGMGPGSFTAPKPQSWKGLAVLGYVSPTQNNQSPILRTACIEGGNRNQPCGMMVSGGHRPLQTVLNSLPAAQGSPKSILSITIPPTAAQRSREPHGQSSGPGQSFGSADITAAV